MSRTRSTVDRSTTGQSRRSPCVGRLAAARGTGAPLDQLAGAEPDGHTRTDGPHDPRTQQGAPYPF